jgi:hypothetical protein
MGGIDPAQQQQNSDVNGEHAPDLERRDHGCPE